MKKKKEIETMNEHAHQTPVTDKQIDQMAIIYMDTFPHAKQEQRLYAHADFSNGMKALRDLQPKTDDCEHKWKVHFVDKKPESRFCPLCEETEYFEIDGFGKKWII